MNLKKLKLFTPVCIHWYDAAAPQHGWGEVQVNYEPGSAISYGMVVGLNKRSITIAPSVVRITESDTEAIADPLVIPLGMISSIKEVTELATKTTKKKVAKKATTTKKRS